ANLPQFKVTVKSQTSLSRLEAIWLLETAMRLGGVVFQPRSKFVFAVPFTQADELARIPDPPAPPKTRDETTAPTTPKAAATPNVDTATTTTTATTAAEEIFPPGLIKFWEANVSQVLEIYQELTGLTLLRAPNTPQSFVSLRSQTDLSRAEANWLV